ncbi:TPA: helix-turn-helix transcriptional regulator, partial [Clostridioides difficile]|nr:helix-turn-helix transcriptional regulator [Clostridioides difficile]
MKINKLKDLRTSKKITQYDMSQMLGIKERTYQNKENGKTSFTIEEFEKIYKYLDI